MHIKYNGHLLELLILNLFQLNLQYIFNTCAHDGELLILNYAIEPILRS